MGQTINFKENFRVERGKKVYSKMIISSTTGNSLIILLMDKEK